MEFAFCAEVSFQAYLLACFALGLLLSAKSLVQVAIPQFQIPRWAEAIAGLAAFVLAFTLGLDALVNGGVSVAVAPPLLALLTVGLGVSLVSANLNVSLLLRRRQIASQPVAWVAVALSLAATGWSSHRYSEGNLKLEIVKSSYFFGGGELETVREFVALTDRGREIDLYCWMQDDGFIAPVQPPAEISRANCHGWVFTGGKYFLGGDSVVRILEDNGYEPCSAPQPGDLIIYRNASGEITHTGLVKAGFPWGSLMIDSKWGLGGRFVHRPEVQPYGNRFSYYRSTRQGHAISIHRAKPVMSLASR
jgi:hypothetical protein